MKNREKQILEWIVEEGKVSLKDLLNRLKISKRTLYYDIESINFYLRFCGQIKNLNGSFAYIGPYQSLQEILKHNEEQFQNPHERCRYVIYKILNNEKITIDHLAHQMDFSRNTVVQILDEVKKELRRQGLLLQMKPYYQIVGKERQIRNLFLLLMQEDNNLLNEVNQKVIRFDRTYQISLTDYSLSSVSKFVEFINRRISEGHFLEKQSNFLAAKELDFYPGVKELISVHDENEQAYLSAYVASCPSLNSNVNADIIETYINKLIVRFEARTAVQLINKEDFKQGIKRHLLSSYYRIKFHFPIYNPILSEIKYKHSQLFKITKDILEDEKDFPEFKGIREEEIGFIAAYFGGYIKGSWLTENHRNRILLVCPNGLMISKNLEIQLYQAIPMIDIIDVISLKELKDYDKPYDTIISTVEIPDYKNVIVVNPLLTRIDIDKLLKRITNASPGIVLFDVDDVIAVIRKHAKITDVGELRKDLHKLFYKDIEKEKEQPMLKDLFNEQRIHKVNALKDWKEAIAYAAEPLLKDGSIDQSYIDEMIKAVETYGPYIVLADGFALPHASNKKGVNELSMALLVVKEPVDLLGKPVHLFVVLASIDNTTHLKALASLTELLYDEKNMEIFKSGDQNAIMTLIREKSEEEEVKE